MSNPFYVKHGPFDIIEILDLLKSKITSKKGYKIIDIKDLVSADDKCITFFIQRDIKNKLKKLKPLFV